MSTRPVDTSPRPDGAHRHHLHLRAHRTRRLEYVIAALRERAAVAERRHPPRRSAPGAR